MPAAPLQNKILRLERTFDATPKEMWAAWTDPKQYAKWLNPAPGLDLVIHEFDVRPGGKIRFDMPQPDGNQHPQEGMFHELAPYSHLVSGNEDKSFLLDVTIEPRGNSRCHLVVIATGVPPEWHAAATVGWNAGFDKLELELARNTPVVGQVLKMERLFDCTPDEMWAAWTDSKLFAKWISPFPGLDAEIHEFHIRPGGHIRFTMVGPDGTRFPVADWLVEVADKAKAFGTFEANRDRPDVFDGHPMREITRFEAVGKQTRMNLEVHGLPESVPLEMARQGFGSGMEKLAQVLAELRKTA